MKISFLGDISLNDQYIEFYRNGVNPFQEVGAMLAKNDFVVGNLECMVKGEKGENELKKPRLTTTVETLNYLKNINLSVACLAQNHVYDHLEDGFDKTTQFLRYNNIKYLGAGKSDDEAAVPIILSQKGITIGIINSVTMDTNPNMPENAKIFLNIFDLEKCKESIISLKETVDHIVLCLHWGGRVEGGLYPDWDQPKLARILIDAGADLIIGHHSHTFQPFEVYKGKYIFYSLGNFCFSDYWFNNEIYPMPKRRLISAVIGIKFSKTEYVVTPDYFFNRIDSFDKYDSFKRKMNFRNKYFALLKSHKAFWNLYYFHFKFILPIFLFMQRKDLTLFVKMNRVSISIKKRLS